MFLGLPIISNGVSYNRTTTENQAFYFSDEAELKNILKNLTDDELSKCAAKMKKIAERRYTWKKVAKKYNNLICEAYSKKPKTFVYPVVSKLDKTILEKYHLEHLKNTKLFNEPNKTA